MKIFSRHASISLYEKVKTLGPYHDSWRSIYLSFSKRNERYNSTLHTHFIVKAIAGLLANNDGYIYLCEDGDIFIFFQGAMRPVLKQLAKQFEDLQLENPAEQPKDSMFSIFDLSKNWDSFYTLCKSKAVSEAEALDDMPIQFPYLTELGKMLTQA